MNRTFRFVLAGIAIAGSVGAVAVAIPPGNQSALDDAKPRIKLNDRFTSDRPKMHSGWVRMQGKFDRERNCFWMPGGGVVRGLSPLDSSGRLVATNAWHGKHAYGPPNSSGAYVIDGDTFSLFLVRPGSDMTVQFPSEFPVWLVVEDR